MIEVYEPDVPGAKEFRQYVRFMASELNRIHNGSDSDFTGIVDQVEMVLANKLPGVSLSVAAWGLFVFGDLLGFQNEGQNTRGLFWQSVADSLLTREETRAALGEDLLPRPEREQHDTAPDGSCSCGETHKMETAEEMIAGGRRDIERFEKVHEIKDGLAGLLEKLGPMSGIPGLNPGDMPDIARADAAFALPAECITEFGMDNVMRFVLGKLARGDHSGVINPDELRQWLNDNPQ